MGCPPLLALCWQLQRRLTARTTGWELLEERLLAAQLAQEGLAAQLDASRDEISDLSQANAANKPTWRRCAVKSSCCRSTAITPAMPRTPGTSTVARQKELNCVAWTPWPRP